VRGQNQSLLVCEAWLLRRRREARAGLPGRDFLFDWLCAFTFTLTLIFTARNFLILR
jgi:hypothetical protein